MTTTGTEPTIGGDEASPGRQRRSPRRLRRILTRTVAAVLAVAIVLLLAGGWYFAGQIRAGAFEVHPAEVEQNLRVVAASRDSVTLAETGDRQGALRTADTYGLAWDTGYGRVTGTPHGAGSTVTRDFVLIDGTMPAPGQRAGLDRDAFPADDAHRALPGHDANEVTFQSPAGDLHAWFAPGRGRTWAILVHGQRATRTQMLRPMTASAAAGLPSLAIGYRNDAHEPADPSHVYGFGQTEWPDLEAAVKYARENGAQRVVLVGYSMGGAVVAAFLQHSDLKSLVSAVVLDSPMLNLSDTVDHQAAARSLPTPLTWTAKQLAALRYHVHWDELDYLADTTWVRTPTLIFHGTEDGTAPPADSRALARAHPDFVQLVLVRHGEHVASWNVDPTRYDHTMIDFLRAHI